MPELKALTGVRFIAAMWVVVFHLRDQIAEVSPVMSAVEPVLAQGHLAVPFFFILSGFILSHVYFPVYSFRQHGRFIWLRFARLWPVHIATTAALILYVVIASWKRGYIPESQYDFSSLGTELGMVRCWFSDVLAWNYPAWSIHCEWFAYIFVFPLCFLLFRSIRSPLLMAAAVFILLAICTFVPAGIFPGKIGDIFILFCVGSALNRFYVLMPLLSARISRGANSGRWVVLRKSRRVPLVICFHNPWARVRPRLDS